MWIWCGYRVPCLPPASVCSRVVSRAGRSGESGCRRSSSPGAWVHRCVGVWNGSALPASVSVWVFEFQKVCGVCSSSSSSETVDFKHLIVNEELL
jgi:hypothetical protein